MKSQRTRQQVHIGDLNICIGDDDPVRLPELMGAGAQSPSGAAQISEILVRPQYHEPCVGKFVQRTIQIGGDGVVHNHQLVVELSLLSKHTLNKEAGLRVIVVIHANCQDGRHADELLQLLPRRRTLILNGSGH